MNDLAVPQPWPRRTVSWHPLIRTGLSFWCSKRPTSPFTSCKEWPSVCDTGLDARYIGCGNAALKRGVVRRVRADLEALKKLALAPLDKPEPELAYIFKHIVTQEVAYESLPYATRAKFHEAIGSYIERRCGDSVGLQVDLLAFHFDRSNNKTKRREYLLKAGEAAQARYANSAAINYYERLLPLLPRNERIPAMLKLGRVLELVGQWNDADRLYQEALALAQELEDRHAHAQCLTAVGELLSKRGAYSEAWNWLEQSRSLFQELGDEAGVAEDLHFSGTVGAQQGDYEKACERYHQSLTVRRKLKDKRHIASLLSNLG